MLTTACPKPLKASEQDKTVKRLVAAWGRQQRWRQSAIDKAKGKPRTKIPQRNEKRIAKRAKKYRAVIASAFHKQLRYKAWERSNGRCECDECREIRQKYHQQNEATRQQWTRERISFAFAIIPIWFTNTAGEPWRRFRSKDGELHHTDYLLFGDENPAELEHVQFTWKTCHQRIESEHGTRRRYLKGNKS